MNWRHFLLFLLLGAFVQCNIAEKTIDNAVAGLQKNEEDISAYLKKLTQDAVRSALEELSRDSNFLVLQQELAGVADTFMLHLSDSLDITANELTENLLGPQTNLYIDSISQQLLGTLRSVKGELLDDDLGNYLSNLIRHELSASLRQMVSDLRYEVSSPATGEALTALRRQIDPQVDTLLRSAITSFLIEYDSNMVPRLTAAIQQVQGVEQKTKRSVQDIIWLALGGLAGLIILGTLAYQFIWRRRYKNLVKVMTRNIDQIKEQATYDDLVGKITKETTMLDLEEPLRYILEEQQLLDQKEWEDKDQQVLKLLAEELAKAQKGGEQNWNSILQTLMEKADKAGLKDHLNSVLNQDRPTS